MTSFFSFSLKRNIFLTSKWFIPICRTRSWQQQQQQQQKQQLQQKQKQQLKLKEGVGWVKRQQDDAEGRDDWGRFNEWRHLNDIVTVDFFNSSKKKSTVTSFFEWNQGKRRKQSWLVIPCGTVVEPKFHYLEVMGLNPARWWPFFCFFPLSNIPLNRIFHPKLNTYAYISLENQDSTLCAA